MIGLIEQARAACAARFGRPATLGAAAPGRVNLIGEHTDYNGGLVLPIAIDRQVVAAAAPGTGGRWRVYSGAFDQQAEITLDGAPGPAAPAWTAYIRGVIAGFLERGLEVPALDLALLSDLPPGAGLSSSAALEVAVATLIEAARGAALDPLDKARLCQQAEQRHAGVPCGIMDQLAAAAGQEGAALLIDCASERWQPVPVPEGRVAVLVVDSRVRHTLADGEYARRRAECEEAARRLGVASLRALDAGRSGSEAAQAVAALPETLARRARHVISENARTLQFAEAFARGDLAAAGALLYEGHRSLRDDFQVSCPELDVLVELARSLGPRAGVFGARLTGGGFGGSAIVLADPARTRELADALARGYADRTGRRTAPFIVRPSAGARVLAFEAST